MNIGIVGLGLIGGSFAKAIKTNTSHIVYGDDLSPTVMEQAFSEKAIDFALNEDSLKKCDIVLLPLYPQAIKEYLDENRYSFSSKSILIDLCGVKETICNYAKEIFSAPDSPLFIGGHPMAGKEVSGFSHAEPTLFNGASMILTPEDTLPEILLCKLEDFFLSLGFAELTLTTPKEHDRVIAFTSQLAHIVSSAYIQSPTAESYLGFSAGSFADLTRVAYLNEDMWTELFLANPEPLTYELDTIIKHLLEFREYISKNETLNLREKLKNGRLRKEKTIAKEEKVPYDNR